MSAREQTSFCCRGCETVYSLLQERGFQDYYRLRDSSKEKNDAILPVFSTENFAYLDDAEFVQLYSFDQGRQMRFYLEGVHCAACVWLTEKLPEFCPGVELLRLDLSAHVAVVKIRDHGSFSQAAQQLAKLGYTPHPVQQEGSEEFRKKENKTFLMRLGVAGMATGNIMLLAVSLYAGADGRLAQVFKWVSFFLYLPVLFYSAVPFYKGAWSALLRKQISIDVPIVIGIWVGTVASIINLVIGSEYIYFDSLAALVFLMLSTRYLLLKVNEKAFNTTQLLHFLVPSKARRRSVDGLFEELKVDLLKEGDIIRVMPGECFPVDGVVESGESVVNRALLTGETEPQTAAAGVRVHAGTSNIQAPLEVRVLTSGSSTRLGKILTAMVAGLEQKAPIVTLLDQVGQAFVVAVLVLTAVGFFLGLQVSWFEAINRALAVAIVVCPCTFALATPLAMSLAMSRAAKQGILVKGAEFVERLSHIDSVFFDKTGTLTSGELTVNQWVESAPGTEFALRALESRSLHPIAKAVHRYFEDSPIALKDLPVVEQFKDRPGVGVSGFVNGAFFEVKRIAQERLGELSASTGTQVGVYRDGILVGALSLSDRVRAESETVIESLVSQGLSVHILSGDSKAPVAHVAQSLGIPSENARYELSPEEKSQILKDRGGRSLMVGDGANDAVALASAYASVAVQGGMEMSMRAAGAYSSRPGVEPLLLLLSISQETMKVIRRNLVFAVFYNIVGIGVALTGHLDPLFAAVLMPMSALTVFLSTMIGTPKLRKPITRIEISIKTQEAIA